MNTCAARRLLLNEGSGQPNREGAGSLDPLLPVPAAPLFGTYVYYTISGVFPNLGSRMAVNSRAWGCHGLRTCDNGLRHAYGMDYRQPLRADISMGALSSSLVRS